MNQQTDQQGEIMRESMPREYPNVFNNLTNNIDGLDQRLSNFQTESGQSNPALRREIRTFTQEVRRNNQNNHKYNAMQRGIHKIFFMFRIEI